MVEERRVSAAQSQPLIIFLHVPKMAGSTLRSIIERRHDSTSILHLYESDFGEELLAIPPRQMDRLRVVMGHFYFGAHTFLSQPSTYITFLRDPIDRVISHYYYAQRAPSHYFYHSARKLSLKEFVEYCSRMSNKSGTALGYCSDNDQTRQLAGQCGVPSFGTSSDEMLNIAKRQLAEHFAVVGITEEFDRSLILISRLLGWRHPYYTKQNVTRRHPRKDELPRETLHVIQAYNELDVELFRYAERLLREQIHDQDPSFENQLRRFKKVNATYGRLHRLVSSVRRGAVAKLPAAVRLLMRHE
jgi:Galactose-3-O-sulfotransferase